MEKLIEKIKDILNNTKIEKHNNFVYQIKTGDAQKKESIKRLIKQGDVQNPSTIVEIDFLDSPVDKKKIKKYTGIETHRIEDNVIIRIWNTPVYIYGEYVKNTREMTQTPLKIEGKLKTARSVSDFGKEFERFFGGDEYKFMGCGREDQDVRCLQGRPFIVEITNPTRNIQADSISISLYSEIDILNCQVASKECKDFVNKEDPCKLYNLLIFSKDQIAFNKNYELQQRTPLRVLHRRADLIRNKTIEVLRVSETKADGFYYNIDIRASSGAYIKEWVNGDFCRTVPNLNADLLELDVIRVELCVDPKLFIRPLRIERLNVFS